jgi:transcriptional regulator with XRE-family HTH domain
MKGHARKHFGQKVRLQRVNRGWSQEVLAELSGLNRSYIGAVERAEHNIGIDNIERISLALETAIHELLDMRETSRPLAVGGVHAAPPVQRATAVVNRKLFLELLQQCGQNHRELVLVYLERCGVTLRD